MTVSRQMRVIVAVTIGALVAAMGFAGLSHASERGKGQRAEAPEHRPRA